MQRGVLKLNLIELKELLNVFDVNVHSDMHLSDKLLAGLRSGMDPVGIEVSEDELETLSDELGGPQSSDTTEMKGVREKISLLMSQFRNTFGV
ncbi:MAG: hypothetical protein UT34_C0001G0033 [candidate division WS6 bacterium GW2011_GWF2_39_15]|uniref:Uncharacterized protein n=1 Tax=candidate division WS6 bacterium GW2011_GWF2_39_15 TaxID=1619100 RepID=A0A0G0MS37_9BACT|nr:MAG: hypothetical protein UT34_C0001G0033 [candidate division WS6 bacterium GW2011_GWF2_39_15]